MCPDVWEVFLGRVSGVGVSGYLYNNNYGILNSRRMCKERSVCASGRPVWDNYRQSVCDHIISTYFYDCNLHFIPHVFVSLKCVRFPFCTTD